MSDRKPPFVHGFTPHAEVQSILRGMPPISRASCRLCRRRIVIIERDYQRAGVCSSCAHQIVLWYAEAHGDGWALLAGVEDPSPSVGRNPKSRKMSATKKVSVWRRDGFKCVKCGTDDNLSVDHILPRSKGGSDDLANLQTLCRPCNSSKGGRVTTREGAQ